VTRRRLQSACFKVAVISGALAINATAAPNTTKVIGHGVRLKGTSIWYAHGKAVAPRTVSARVVSTPAQSVKVQWSVVCQKPNSSDPAVHLGTDAKSGQTSVHGAATVKLALPYAKPPACIATVYATLAGDGTLVLRLLET
jgi:hypothetical protein